MEAWIRKKIFLLVVFFVANVKDHHVSAQTWSSSGDVTSDQMGSFLGHTVSVSGDGTLVAVGEPSRDNGSLLEAGRCTVYEKPSGVTAWTTVFVLDGDAANANAGFGCRLARNARRVVIGIPGEGFQTGRVRVYGEDDNDGVWKQIGKTLSGGFTRAYFGYAVDISADGNIIILGGPSLDAVPAGFVSVYELISDEWVRRGIDLTGDSPDDYFGSGTYIEYIVVLFSFLSTQDDLFIFMSANHALLISIYLFIYFHYC
jgi:hypothetical protein